MPPRRTACCARCGVALYRDSRNGLDRALALALAAVVLLVLSNALPIASLEVRGLHTETTLWGAVNALYDQDMGLVAALVFITTMLTPAIELATILYMLIPLKLGLLPAHLSLAFRLAPLAREWGLVDVFMLGIVVSLIKLNDLALVIPGIALGSFGALILLLTAVGVAFNPRELWLRTASLERATSKSSDSLRRAQRGGPDSPVATPHSP